MKQWDKIFNALEAIGKFLMALLKSLWGLIVVIIGIGIVWLFLQL